MLKAVILLCSLLLAAPLFAAEPDMTVHDLQGRVHRLSDYRGKWVVVNYWASWCPPCRAELPDLEAFYQKHRHHDAVVLGFNMEQIGRQRLLHFVEEYAITYPVIPLSPQLELVGPVTGLPTTYLINPQGQVAARKVGGITGAEIERFIKTQTNNETTALKSSYNH